MIRSTLMATVALSPLLLTPAVAQQTFDLGTIALSSSLSPVELGRTGTTVEVLESDQIGTQDSAIVDRLNRLPGVSSSSSGGVGTSSTLRIRGLPPRYVGTRINGIDVTDSASPQTSFDFGGLLGGGIERVEVLKGSQSALYGSEAIAGVVNVTTFQPTEMGFSGNSQFEFGSYDTLSGSASVGHRSERGFIAMSYGRFVTDGFSSRTQDSALTTETEDDGFQQTTVNVTGEYDLTDRATIGAVLYLRDSMLDYDISRTESAGTITRDEVGTRLYTRVETGVVAHTLSYSYFDSDRDVLEQDFANPGSFLKNNYRGTRRSLQYLGNAVLSDRVTLNFGAEYTEEEYRSPGISASEDNTSINGEIIYSPTDNFDISAALRFDDNSTFDGKLTGRLAGVWRPSDDLVLRAVVGTGFRAPSLNERFGPWGANPDLTPEESLSFEVGAEKLFTNGSIKATLFQTGIYDIIDYVNTYVQVAGKTTSKGLELAGTYDLSSRVSVFGNYTYTDAKQQNGTRQVRVPRHDLAFGVETQLTDRLNGSIDARYVADFAPVSAYAPADNNAGDYTVIGANFTFDIDDTKQAYLRVENLFDEKYETSAGYNQEGQSAYFGISAKF